MIYAAALIVLSLAALVGNIAVLVRDLRKFREASERHQETFLAVAQSIAETMPTHSVERVDAIDERVADIIAHLTQLDHVVDGLPVKWEEMVNKARRTEERTRGAVRRARRQLQANGFDPDEEIEGLHEELRSGDEPRGEGGGVQPMPQSMDPSPTFVPPGQITPEVRALALRRKYGTA